MRTNELIETIQNTLFQWYDFPIDADVYWYNRETVGLQQGKKYDYILSKADIETYENPLEFLQICKSLLKENGHLLLGVNNRLGLRYFCGDKDLYTQQCFDGIEDYVNVYVREKKSFQGRMYAKAELKKFLEKAGFLKCRFFSVFSDLNNPFLIYREDFLPNEDFKVRTIPTYYHPDTVFFEERLLYNALIENDLFHPMANAYIIECIMNVNGELSDVQHVTSSIERGKESAMLTIIHDSKMVEKRALYQEGQKRLEKLYQHGEELRKNGIKVVPVKYENDCYEMPFVKYENGQMYLKRLLQEDKEQFLKALDLFRDTILKSSKIVKKDKLDGEGATLEYGYLDLVPLNSFFDGTEFVFYDQEFRESNYPANVLIFRMIATLYYDDAQIEKKIPKEVLFQRYHLEETWEQWQQMEWDFLDKLRNKEELEEYHNKIHANAYEVHCNRKRMEYSANSYTNIFENLDTKKLILFGSGLYAERFFKYFGKKYPIYAVVDNQESKWGILWRGVPIYAPKWLLELKEDEYKVIICVGNYEPIVRQLDKMGIREYGIFDIQRLFSNMN